MLQQQHHIVTAPLNRERSHWIRFSRCRPDLQLAASVLLSEHLDDFSSNADDTQRFIGGESKFYAHILSAKAYPSSFGFSKDTMPHERTDLVLHQGGSGASAHLYTPTTANDAPLSILIVLI